MLAEGELNLHGALDSEDTRVMLDGLRRLGIAIDVDSDGSHIRVAGCSGRLPADEARIFAANSGTTIRFLTALVALGNGTFHLDGSPRMRRAANSRFKPEVSLDNWGPMPTANTATVARQSSSVRPASAAVERKCAAIFPVNS